MPDFLSGGGGTGVPDRGGRKVQVERGFHVGVGTGTDASSRTGRPGAVFFVGRADFVTEPPDRCVNRRFDAVKIRSEKEDYGSPAGQLATGRSRRFRTDAGRQRAANGFDSRNPAGREVRSDAVPAGKAGAFVRFRVSRLSGLIGVWGAAGELRIAGSVSRFARWSDCRVYSGFIGFRVVGPDRSGRAAVRSLLP